MAYTIQYRRIASGTRAVRVSDDPRSFLSRLHNDDEVCGQIREIFVYGANETGESKLARIVEAMLRSERYSEEVSDATHDTAEEDYRRYAAKRAA